MNEKLGRFVTLVSGGLAYSIIDKILNYRSDNAEAVLQANRDQNMENISNNIETIGTNVNIFSKMFSDNLNLLIECSKAFGDRNNAVVLDMDQTLKQLKEIPINGNNILNQFNEIKAKSDWNIDRPYEDYIELLKCVDDIIDKINKDNGNNVVSGLSDFYQFVENLSLLQHLVLLDILLFLVIILTIINIFSALFGNEIIKYFNIETRFPKLSVFFKIRSTLQKYYLIWSIFVLMFVCIFAIIINTVSLYLTLT